MNTSIISHRMFVAALTNDGQSPARQPVARRDFEPADAARIGGARPSSKTLAEIAARPWVNWPFGGVMEERSAI